MIEFNEYLKNRKPMLTRFRYVIMLVIVLLSALKVGAQIAMPDYVYIGSTKHYNVYPTSGSTYTWKIDEVVQSSTTNEIDITWNSPGKFTLTVQEHSAAECDGPVRSGEVYVFQFTLPDPFNECVEEIHNAYYNSVKKEVVIEHPDYYTFKPGDTRLDLTPANFTDILPSSCMAEIHWQIDFSPTPDPITHNPVTKPSVSGTGQPSKITGNIQFPGDGDDYNNVVHSITYQILDCNNRIIYKNSQTISIKPRPKIL
jgi:hypothetical protein